MLPAQPARAPRGVAVRDELMAAIRDNNMAPYYEALCKYLDWQMDTDLLNKMKKANEEELKRLDEELEDARRIWERAKSGMP